MSDIWYKNQKYINVNAKTDAHCYRCKRELMGHDEQHIRSHVDMRPHANPKTQQESEANGQWYTGNLGMWSEEALRVVYMGGYHSNQLDGLHVHLMLCENCVIEVLGPYLKVQHQADEYHYHRRLKRAEQDIQNRWEARKVRRAIEQNLGNQGSDKQRSKI